MTRVLFIVTSAGTIGPRNRPTGYSFPEVAHPYDAFRRAGVGVAFATPRGGTPPLDDYDPADPIQRAFMEGDGFKALNESATISEVDTADFDAVFFPGGLGPVVDLTDDADAATVVRSLWEAGKVVSAVCHGPAALLNVRLSDGSYLVDGKTVSAFTNDEEERYAQDDVPYRLQDELVARGALHQWGDTFAETVVVDGRLITGQNPASAAGVARAVISALASPARRLAA